MLKYATFIHTMTQANSAPSENDKEIPERNLHKNNFLIKLKVSIKFIGNDLVRERSFSLSPTPSSILTYVLRRRFPRTGDEAALSPLELDVRFWTKDLSVSL